MSDEAGTDVVVPGKSGDLMPWELDDGLIPGLEDFDESQVTIPRFTIVQDEAVFKDSLSGAKIDKLENVVILGFVHQRVCWDPEEQGSSPLCRSNDGKTGFPGKAFPWSAAKLVASDFDADQPQVPCASCNLREWGTMPGKETPWCTDQRMLMMLAPAPGAEGGALAPALLAIQRSGVKAIDAYISSYVRVKQPMFTGLTTISLSLQKKGAVEYSTPNFERVGDTERDNWGEWVEQYRAIRVQITRPPVNDLAPAGDGAESSPASAAPIADDDDVPF